MSEFEIDGQKHPILFLAGAEVTLSVEVTKEASGGVNVWVLNGAGNVSSSRAGTVRVTLNTGGGAGFGVGM